MRLSTFLFLLTFLTNSLFAQKKVAVEYGPTQKLKFKEGFLHLNILGTDNTGLYALQVPYAVLYNNYIGGIRTYHLAKYNTDLTKSSSFSIDTIEKEDNKSFLKTFVMNHQLYVVSAKDLEKEQKKEFYVETINKKTFEPKQDVKKIASIDVSANKKNKNLRFKAEASTEAEFSKSATKYSSNFGMEFSADSSKILLAYRVLDKHLQAVSHGFQVMDKNFNTLWKYENPTSGEEGILSQSIYRIDNNGAVYLLQMIYDNQEEFDEAHKLKKKSLLSSTRRTVREANYSFKVFTFQAGKKINTLTLPQTDKFLAYAEMGISNKNEVVFTGFWADKGKASIKGAFSMKLAKGAKAIANQRFTTFEEEFITRGFDEKAMKRYQDNINEGKEFDETEYMLNDIVFHKNGTYSLIAEQFYIEVKTHSNPRTGTYVENNYHDGDIWMINFKADGSLNWKQKVLKKQHTTNMNRIYASFAYYIGGDKTGFVFNDIPANGKYKKSVVCAVSIDLAGNVVRDDLFSSAETKFVLQPRSFKQINQKQLVVLGQKILAYQLVKLEF